MFINILYEVINIMSDKKNFKFPFRRIKSKYKLLILKRKCINYIDKIESFNYKDILSFCNFVSEADNYITLSKGITYNNPIKYISLHKNSDYFHLKMYENIYNEGTKNNYIHISIPNKDIENNFFELKVSSKEKNYSLVVYDKINPETLWSKISFFNIDVDVFKIFNNYKKDIENIFFNYIYIIKGGHNK